MKLHHYGFILALLLATHSIGQISGNQVYGNHSNNHSYINTQKRNVSINESKMTINVSLLFNQLADEYMITLGVSQDAETVIECNKKINERIDKFKASLSGYGVKDDDIYIDFISQTKIYDFEMANNQAEEISAGFEIKKNIIFKLKEIENIDVLVDKAAALEIYDLIKVEYINENINDIYNQLFDEAHDLILSKKERYLKACDVKLNGESRITTDNFYAVSPKTQYKQYFAFETSNVTVYNNRYNDRYVKKEARKHKTFYYDGLPTSGFDKVINGSNPKVGLQYVFSMTMEFDLAE